MTARTDPVSVRDGMDLLVLVQRIRRNFPALTAEMNLIVDVISDGPVSFAIDEAIAKGRVR